MTTPQAASETGRRKGARVLFLVAVLTVVLVYFLWWRTSYRRVLTDGEIEARLTLEASDFDIQHALEQLYGRLGPRMEGRERFREPLVRLAQHPRWEVRRQVAWVLGREPAFEYIQALAALLEDDDAGVRLNAACALSNSGDERARPVLLAGLDNWDLKAPAAGRVHWQVKAGDPLSMGRPAGLIRFDGGGSASIDVALNGFAEELVVSGDARVERGDVLARVSPDPKNAVNLLVALQAVGRSEDLPVIEAIAAGRRPRLAESREVRLAAERAADAIRRR